LLVAVGACAPAAAVRSPEASAWVPLFNGRDLSGWTPKIAGHELGENFANTFRVAGGVLAVRYDGYADFNSQFGHLFYKAPFSQYHLVIEYRLTGEWQRGTPD